MNKLLIEKKKNNKDIKQNVLLLTWAPQKILEIMNFNKIQNLSRATEFAIQHFSKFVQFSSSSSCALTQSETKFDILCILGPIRDKSKAEMIYSRWLKSKDFYEKLIHGKEMAIQHRLNYSYHLVIFLKCIIIDRNKENESAISDEDLTQIAVEKLSLSQGINLRLQRSCQ